jgi:hypothetical protein
MNRGFSLPAILVVVSVVSILIIGAYLMGQKSSDTSILTNSEERHSKVLSSPSPVSTVTDNETNKWLTFSDENYGFSIKYPSDWTITDRMSEGIPTVKVSKFFNFENKGDIENGNWAHLRLDSAIDEAKISEWNNTKYENSYSKAEIVPSDFQGEKLYRVTSTHHDTSNGVDKETYSLYTLYIPTKDGYIQLASNLKMKDTLEKMLSTFQVTK